MSYTFLPHLIELRCRFLRVSYWFVILFCLAFYYSTALLHVILAPLSSVLPESNSLIVTKLTAIVITPIKLAMYSALLGSIPYALLQAWQFMLPGLYKAERGVLRFAIVSSLILFAAGVVFCFYIVLPLVLSWMVHATPQGVVIMPDMADAVDLVLRFLLLFGLAFQVPILCVFAVRVQLLDIQSLRVFRPYFIVIAFIFGMLLTPPDVLSQVLLAVPLCILYELGIVFASLQRRAKF